MQPSEMLIICDGKENGASHQTYNSSCLVTANFAIRGFSTYFLGGS